MNRPELAVLTEADLEGAANKLTVKRARMDLDEGMAPESVGEEGDDLVVIWADATCRFGPGGLLAATCTCPSRRLCRHRVRSVLHLNSHHNSQEHPGAEPEPVDGPRSPAEYDLAELRRAAGAPLWRKACDLMVRGLEARIESDDLVTFPTLGIRVRFAPGLALEAAMCSCGAVGLCEHRLVAALSFQDEVPEVHAKAEGIQDTCAQLWPRLVEILRVGLDTLPVELAGDLHVLSRQIKTTIPAASDDLRHLASLIEANERRSARFSPDAWLRATARLAVRLTALEGDVAPGRRLHLVGRNRRDYIEAASLRLWALGAEGFASARGSLLRLWFIQPDTGGFLHVNVGRSGSASIPPAALWNARMLWGDHVPASLCGANVQVIRPQLSPDGALSSSEKTSARSLAHQPITLAGLDPTAIAASVDTLRTRWRKQLPPLLRPLEAATLPALVACDPELPLAAAPVFDAHSQTLLVPLELADGGTLTLEVRHRPGDDALLDALSQVERWHSAPTHWLVRFWPTARGLRAVPIAVWFAGDDRPHALGFSDIKMRDSLPIKPATIHGLPPLTDPLDTALDGLLAVLTHVVCNGLGRHSPHHERRLHDAATHLHRLGLTHAVTQLQAFLTERDADKSARLVGGLVAWAMSLQEAWYL